MLSWLNDNFALLVMLLSMAALVLLYAWWKTRRRPFALGAGAAGVLLGLLCLTMYAGPLVFGETDGQQIERKIREMAAGVKSRNLDGIFSHISNDFRHQSLDKASFRQRAGEVLRGQDVDEMVVWNFEHGAIDRARRLGHINFLVKVRANYRGSEAPYLCRAEFVLDPDGQWRMRGFEIFNAFRESDQPLRIPGI